jgi:hypothetical protein
MKCCLGCASTMLLFALLLFVVLAADGVFK